MIVLLSHKSYVTERPDLEVPDSVDGIIIASEDLKLERKADENSEMEEKIETKVKEDTGQGSMDSATRTRLGQICYLQWTG